MDESDILKFRIKVVEKNNGEKLYYPQVWYMVKKRVYWGWLKRLTIPHFGKPYDILTKYDWCYLKIMISVWIVGTNEEEAHVYYASEKERAYKAISEFKQQRYENQRKIEEQQQKEYDNKIKSETYINIP